jgi:hypothetical protein
MKLNSNEISNYILSRKRKNSNLSVRLLAKEVSSKFNTNISKSAVSLLLNKAKLSSPVGRKVATVFRPAGETAGAGFSLLLGANYLLGLSKILANSVKAANPILRLKSDTISALSEAWLMSKAIYNIPLGKIENYSKNDLWFIIGKKANKGILKKYIDALNFMQPINLQLVRELSHILQDVHYFKFRLADGSEICLDGQQKTIWRDQKIPLNFCITIDIANSYMNSIFLEGAPFIIMSAKPESVLGEELADFIFCLDGSSANKRIREIEFISPNGHAIKEIPFVPPQRRRFLVGVWPWQYKPIGEIEKRKAPGKFVLEPLGQEFFFVEEQIRFTQHVDNNEVMLRLIVIKSGENGPARMGILTNLGEEQTAGQIVERYIRCFPQVEASHMFFLNAVKSPLYFEDFISSEKILADAKKILESADPDAFFTNLVDILHLFAKRCFFPADCAVWSLLKMRELFYKQPGFIKRDMASDILFNLNNINKIQQNEHLIQAATRFNEMPIFDEIGRKLWLSVQP